MFSVDNTKMRGSWVIPFFSYIKIKLSTWVLYVCKVALYCTSLYRLIYFWCHDNLESIPPPPPTEKENNFNDPIWVSTPEVGEILMSSKTPIPSPPSLPPQIFVWVKEIPWSYVTWLLWKRIMMRSKSNVFCKYYFVIQVLWFESSNFTSNTNAIKEDVLK